MGYSSSDLADSLYTLFTTQSNPNTMLQHFKDLSTVYNNYGKDVVDTVASNVLLTNGISQFESTFNSYPSSSPSLLIYATYIENACRSYWQNTTFSLVNKPTGWESLLSISITPMSVSSISTTLSSLFVTANGNPSVLSQGMANIIHTATTTVSLTLTGTASSVSVTATGQLKKPTP
jgi:hypothetical protein